MAIPFAELQVKLDADMGEFARGMATGTKQISKMQKASKGLSRTMKQLVGVMSTGAAIAALRQTADELDKIGKTADKVGLTTDALQSFQYGAELAGVEANKFNVSMQRFSRRVGEAAKGTGVLAGEFEDLGISATNADGSIRSTEEVLYDYADAISNAESEQEALRLAFKAFDSEGAQLALMLKDGSAGLDEFKEKAIELGLVMDEEAIRSAEAFNDAIGTLGRQMTVLYTNVFGDTIYYATQLATSLVNTKKDTDSLTTASMGLATTFGIVANTGRILFNVLQNVGVGIARVTATLVAFYEGGAERAMAAWDAGAEDFQKNVTDIVDAAEELGKVFKGDININLSSKTENKDPLAGPRESVESLSDTIDKQLVSSVDGFANAFVSMAQGSEDAFKNFATSVIADITRIIVKTQTLQMLQQSMPGIFGTPSGGTAAATASGNMFSGGISLPHGIYNSPTRFAFANGGILGEAGAEAVLPLRRGANGHLGVEAGGGTVVNVINNTGSEAQVSETQRPGGGREITVLIESTVEKGFTRGRFDNSLNNAYGLSRWGA